MKKCQWIRMKTTTLRILLVTSTLGVSSPCKVFGNDLFRGNGTRGVNPLAVEKVISGELTEASAAWWGFNPEDATASLQAAIDSGVKKVVVPNMGRDWVITPVTLASDQEIFFEPGVVITAKPGAFHGQHDSLFKALDQSNIKLTGYGATLRMQKTDYMSDRYQKAEWRSGIFLDGCSGVEIRGMTIRDTGGDGIYFGNWGRGYSDNITIEDVEFDNNYRQGISVISAENVRIENCVFKNTGGTGPAAGIDLEPDGEDNRLVDILVRNCVADNNEGPGFVVSPAKLTAQSRPISVVFENCLVRSGKGHGIMVSAMLDNGPQGYIEFRDCHVMNTKLHGVRILDKSSSSALVRFINCTWNNVATGNSTADGGLWDLEHPNRYDGVPNVPIIIHLRGQQYSNRPGGILFQDCVLFDDFDRAFIAYRAPFKNAPILHNVAGNITVINPNGATMDLGERTSKVNLRVFDEPGS